MDVAELFLWYGIGSSFRTNGIMTKETYIEISENMVLPWAEVIFTNVSKYLNNIVFFLLLFWNTALKWGQYTDHSTYMYFL